MQVITGVSNRHIHLNVEDYKILFKDTELESIKPLLQTGQYASSHVLSIKTPKRTIENVRLLGPLRSYTQVEISKTDAYSLGINPPVRSSGNFNNAEMITIIGPYGEVTKPCCIIADRHLHINPTDREKMGLTDIDTVSMEFETEKGVIFKNVHLKESPDGVLEFHIDTDDANGSLIKTGDMATIILEK